MHDGYCYFTTDDGKFYIDYIDASDNNTLKRRAISGVSVEYIEGTQTSSTNAWTGQTADTTLYKGKIIAYKLPKAGTSSAATLNLTLANGTTTGTKAVKRQGGSNTTTHYPAGTVIFMAYDGTQWQVNADYDSNTNNAVTQSVTTASAWRKVLLHYTTNAAGEDVPAEVTNRVYAAKGIEVQPSTGTLSASKFKGPLEGNANTATAFNSDANITLSGDVSGSASSTRGWDITTTLATTGVTAGSYGPSTNATPGYGVTFNVPYITVDAKGRITAASTKTVKIPASDNTNTATAADNILDGSNSGTQITYAPYTTQQSKLSFDTSTAAPIRTDRLNLNGYLYATKLYSGGAEVLTSHQSLANYKTKQTAISDSTGTSESTAATRFIYSISQNANGEISVKTRPLPTYNNYSLPLAASGTRGGIQVGYSSSGKNYAVQLSSEKAYVNVPWTDTLVKQTAKTDSVEYKLLTTTSASPTSGSAAEAGYGTNLAYNPSLNRLSTGNLKLTGELDVTGNTSLHNQTSIDSLTAGSLIVNGNANFINDVAFTKIPTAPTAAAGTNNTQLATTAFVSTAVSQGFNANDAMVFKGTLGTAGTVLTLPAFGYQAGWTYRVATSGTYAGEYCEVGDLLIAINDGPSSGTSVINDDWAKIEHNIDGALYKTYSTSYSGGKVLVSSGTNGAVKEGTTSTETVIKTITFSAGSVPTLGTAIPADDITAWSAGSLPTLGTAISADDITAWDAGSVPTLGTAIPADDITSWSAGTLPALTISSVSCDDITSWNAGAVTTASVENGVLTITTGTKASLSYTSRSVGSASNWSTGSLPSLSYTAKSIPNVTDVGSAPSLSYTSRSIPNVTGVGTLPSLSYTAKSIPNVTKVGTAPTLTTTTQSVVTGIS